jgi:hypothetical protein
VLCGGTICSCAEGLGRPILLGSFYGTVDETKDKITIKSKSLESNRNYWQYTCIYDDDILGNATWTRRSNYGFEETTIRIVSWICQGYNQSGQSIRSSNKGIVVLFCLSKIEMLLFFINHCHYHSITLPLFTISPILINASFWLIFVFVCVYLHCPHSIDKVVNFACNFHRFGLDNGI